MSLTKQDVSHRVLLVDDNEAVRAMMSATLERKGFEVVSAASVPEALKYITTESFDVLITDLHMHSECLIASRLRCMGRGAALENRARSLRLVRTFALPKRVGKKCRFAELVAAGHQKGVIDGLEQ